MHACWLDCTSSQVLLIVLLQNVLALRFDLMLGSRSNKEVSTLFAHSSQLCPTDASYIQRFPETVYTHSVLFILLTVIGVKIFFDLPFFISVQMVRHSWRTAMTRTFPNIILQEMTYLTPSLRIICREHLSELLKGFSFLFSYNHHVLWTMSSLSGEIL